MDIDMAFQTEAEKEAERFIERVKSILRSKDNLIYGIDSSIDKPNVISPSTVNNRDAWVEVIIYNASSPEDVLSPHEWVRLGEMGADIDMHSGDRHYEYNPSIEFHKRF
jgi:hypothetical protein